MTRSKKRDAKRGGSTSVSLPVLSADGLRSPSVAKSKMGRRRALVLGLVQVLIVIHVLHWIITGSTISPVEPSESMEFVRRGAINAGAIFFGLALLSTLILGRWFCGWGCHVVMLQDLCSWCLRKFGLRPKPFRARLLMYVPFVFALYMFVWPALYRWGLAPLSESLHRSFEFIPDLNAPLAPFPGFSSELTTTDFWETFAKVSIAIPFLFICGFATVYFLGNKGFCTYGCPYGGFFAPVDQFAPGRIRVTDDCERCGHCTAVCTSNVRVHEEVAEHGMVVDPGCMKCMDCVSVCPNDALYFGFGPRPGKAPVLVEKTDTRRPKYDLTMVEEVAVALVFTLSFLAYRGVYELVPMLMAIGMALCTTFLAWKFWRLLGTPNVSFHRFRMKYHGTWRLSGVVFAAMTSLVLLLTAHSGLVRIHMKLADRADGRVFVPTAMIFSPAPIEIGPEMREAATTAIEHYQRASFIGDGGIGLFPHSATTARQAWLYACLLDFEASERVMRQHIDRFGMSESSARDLAQILLAQNREDDVGAHYASVIEAHPEYVLLIDDHAQFTNMMGRPMEASAILRRGIEAAESRGDDEGALLLIKRLSLIVLDAGKFDEGIALVHRSIEMGGENPLSYVVLARAYRVQGDLVEARRFIERAAELESNIWQVAEEMAEVLKELGDPAAAEWDARATQLRQAPHGH